MLFYFSVIGITTILAWLCSHTKGIKNKAIYILLILFPSAIAGLRGVGTDYKMYVSHFTEIVKGDFYLADYNSIMVQGFKIWGRLGGSAQTAIFFVSLVTIWVAFKIIFTHRRYINTTFAVFSYMTIFYLMSFNLFRQMLAAEIFLLATIYLFEHGNKKKFWIYFVLASLIHSAVFPFVLVYLCKDIITGKKQRKKRIIIYSVSLLFVVMMPQMASLFERLVMYIPHYAWFLTRFEYTQVGVGVLRYIVLAMLPAILIKKSKYVTADDYHVVGYTPFYAVLGTVLWCSSYVTTATIYRASYMFLIVLPILHGYIFKRYYNRRKGIIVALVGMVLLLFSWYDFIYLNSGEVYPYVFCF